MSARISVDMNTLWRMRWIDDLAGCLLRFFSTVELVNALEEEKSQGKAGQLVQALNCEWTVSGHSGANPS